MYLKIYTNGNIYTLNTIKDDISDYQIRNLDNLPTVRGMKISFLEEKQNFKDNEVASSIAGTKICGNVFLCLSKLDSAGKLSFYPLEDEECRMVLQYFLDRNMICNARTTVLIWDKILCRKKMASMV